MQKLTNKQRLWQKRIHNWSTSGLSQADYCRQQGIDPSRFYGWKNRLENIASPVAQGEFLPVEILTNEVERNPTSVSLWVNGVEIRITHETDETLLSKALSLLESRS